MPEKRRPKILSGNTSKIKTGCGSTFITLNKKGEILWEVFIRIGKSGGCASANCEALGRVISLALQAGVEVKSLIKNLEGICCHSPTVYEGVNVTSCADAIAKILKEHLEKSEQPK
jgi:ribonucleoside-diphosphate reductase alpha chain